MGHSYVPRNPRGQQRDKIYREALRLELADMSEGVDLKKLRQIARAHIEKAANGDLQAIKELADRLDGRPAQILEHSGPDNNPITKIVREIVHTYQDPEMREIMEQRNGKGDGQNGNGSLNGNGRGSPEGV